MRRSPLIHFSAGNTPVVNENDNGNNNNETDNWHLPAKGATLKRNVQLDQLKLFMKEAKFDLVKGVLGWFCLMKI